MNPERYSRYLFENMRMRLFLLSGSVFISDSFLLYLRLMRALIDFEQAVPASGKEQRILGLKNIVRSDVVQHAPVVFYRDDIQPEAPAQVHIGDALSHELLRKLYLGDVDLLAELNDIRLSGRFQPAGQSNGHIRSG